MDRQVDNAFVLYLLMICTYKVKTKVSMSIPSIDIKSVDKIDTI